MHKGLWLFHFFSDLGAYIFNKYFSAIVSHFMNALEAFAIHGDSELFLQSLLPMIPMLLKLFTVDNFMMVLAV